MMNKIPVLIYTDIGDDVDDMLALVYLLWASNIDIVGVICGHKKIRYRVSITKQILKKLHTEIPVMSGFEHTKDQEKLKIFLEAIVKKYTQELVILSIAPNDNLRQSIACFPDLFAQIKGIYFQWQVYQQDGKIFPDMQSYNFAQEPDAISQIIQQDIPMTFVSKYLAYQIPLYQEDFDLLAQQKNPVWWYLEKYTHAWKRRLKKLNPLVHQRLFGGEKKDIFSYPYDLLTAACISHPEMFISKQIGNRTIIWNMPDERAIQDKESLKKHLLDQIKNVLE